MTNNNEAEKQQWKIDHDKILGASEISPAIRTTCPEDMIKKAMGESTKDFMESKDFSTPYELYHLKKGTLESKPFCPIRSEFGHKMEKFAEMYFNNFLDICKVTHQPQKVVNSDQHKLAGYTPDILGEFISDADFKGYAVSAGERFVLEVKTYDYFMAKKDNINEIGSKWSYIMQNQYQVWQEQARDKNYKWGIIAHIVPLKAEYNNDFYKGKACLCCDNIANGGYKKLQEWYDINIWVYPIYESLHPLFLNALNVWDNMLQNDIEPTPDYLRDHSSVAKLLKNDIPEIKSHCKIKYGIDDGCIPLDKFMDGNINVFDDAKILYEKLSELKELSDDVKVLKTKFFSAFKQAGILGIDDERFTIKIGLAGSGVGITCQFKNYEEMQSGKTASEKY